MIGLIVALVVAVLLAAGVYLVLQRRAISTILGLGLLSHGVNLLLFSSGRLARGVPPIVLDKTTFHGEIADFVDPLPQALILTAIVISFGISAFAIALLNRRYDLLQKEPDEMAQSRDPLISRGIVAQPPAADDYEWLEDVRYGVKG